MPLQTVRGQQFRKFYFTAPASVTTNSSTFQTVATMPVTAGSGTYTIFYSAEMQKVDNTGYQFQLTVDGVEVAQCEPSAETGWKPVSGFVPYTATGSGFTVRMNQRSLSNNKVIEMRRRALIVWKN